MKHCGSLWTGNWQQLMLTIGLTREVRRFENRRGHPTWRMLRVAPLMVYTQFSYSMTHGGGSMFCGTRWAVSLTMFCIRFETPISDMWQPINLAWYKTTSFFKHWRKGLLDCNLQNYSILRSVMVHGVTIWRCRFYGRFDIILSFKIRYKTDYTILHLITCARLMVYSVTR